ncbi:hypothetical protein [Deinococcus sedimenti]|uniref:Uncharacterized protein n=1 Tax=Deinococcus sedimenti TaxID=1867090 RepID=A0ABQ2SBW2_9DEIO|nr:hypothetical protein [Deinococcus sedimenti]GGS11154.1 hypothetical protein GCM10008960_41450 [Deinococcus sedimenti]
MTNLDPPITFRVISLRPASPRPQADATPPAQPPERPTGPYPLPETTADALQVWAALRSGATLDPHRAYLMHLVAQALEGGLIYSVQLRAHVLQALGDLLSDEQRGRTDQHHRTEGGIIGLEIHLAREQLRFHAQQHGANAPLHVGQRLGTLIWHDLKRTLACEITHISGAQVTLTGRREVSVTADAQYIEDARARTRGPTARDTPTRPL